MTKTPVTVLQGFALISLSALERKIKRGGSSYRKEVFSASEMAYCDPKRMKIEHYAARYAAKIAFLKTLDHRNGSRGAVNLAGIEIGRAPSGKPFLKLRSGIRKRWPWLRHARTELSIAHERRFAAAMVLLIIP